jgi:ABC-type polysaccharide/polyol phosphate transport system ATPase subunit
LPTLPEGTIHAEHIWKRFRKDRHRKLLRDEFERVLKGRHRGTASGWRWALRDVNVMAEPGESVGLVGANGSGKSTTLRILAGVTYPPSGRLQVRGRVGALIEVRAGIHPDLTGRENIYLYGSMLGLSRKAVARRFDDIVAFAELDSAIDRQVKHFSSGMQMRLGFSIAAFLEPDILLVDEVLAVGDANFQQKCMDRMRAVLQAGTTIVFVSHDLPAVEAMCSRGIWLHNGMVRADGPVREVLSSYRRLMEEIAEVGGQVDSVVRLLKAEVSGPGGEAPSTHETLEVRTVLETTDPHWGLIYFGVSEGPATPIFVLRRDAHLVSGETEVRCDIGDLPLPRGRYYLWVGMFESGDATGRELLSWHPAAHFDVSGPQLEDAPRAIVRLSPIQVQSAWTVEPR